ncbi:MAG TPA: serine/threonine-protein kinase, partial [Acidimicrobiia bacterium]|nr:serine/threonine-protein kinase [Acidimicrobiia bacterium]
ARLSHPGIVTVYDSGEDVDGPFIVQELVEGTTLAVHLAENGPLSPEPVVDIISQVAAALDHAHGLGVIHRDIKPANLILEPGGRVRLADFGIARTVDDAATITASGEMVGTITYLAPEILSGDPATVASDVYSLGAVTYELFSGSPPFQAETPAAMLEAVRSAEVPDLHGIAPDAMAAAVSAAMSKDPTARPETAGSLAAALIGSATLVMATAPVSPSVDRGSEEPTVVTGRPPPPPVRPTQPVRKRRSPWPVLLLLLAAVVVAVAAMTNDPTGADQDTTPTTTAVPTTTTPPTTPTTTVAPTTTTIPPTTTTATTPAVTAEVVAGEISALLAAMSPPEFRPRDVRQLEDRLERVMEEWEGDNRDDLRRELERAFEEVADLDESQEREELTARLIELSELMGFRVDQIGQGNGKDDDG